VVGGYGFMAVNNSINDDSYLLQEGVLFVVENGIQNSNNMSQLYANLINKMLHILRAPTEVAFDPEFVLLNS
jgi:hypothetical protein